MLALIIMLSVAVPAYACNNTNGHTYVSAQRYKNTHRNTGQNIVDLLAVARRQIGYEEHDPRTGLPISPNGNPGCTKYGVSFGNPTGEWCAYFVSWCARQAGISTSVVPRLGNCAAAVSWYKKYSNFRTPSTGYVPKAGDIVFFNWAGGETAKHIGIVTGVSGDRLYTIEGNTDSDRGYRCAAKVRSRSANYIVGYGVPAYNDAKTYVGSHSFVGAVSDSIKYTTSKLVVITTSATEITSTNAMLHGAVTNGGRLRISDAGFFFGEDKDNLVRYPVRSATTSSSLEMEMDVAQKVGDLTPNTTYYYRTYACIDGGIYLGPTYAVVTVNDIPQKLALSESVVHVGVGQTTEVMWAQIPYGSTDKGVTWKSADEKIATVTNEGLIKGISYGNVKLTATTNYGSATAECQVDVLIPTVENLRIFNDSENQITLTWNAVPDADGYIVYRSESPDEEPAEYKRLKADTTEFDDTRVDPGKRYYYSIVTLAKEAKYDSDPTPVVYATACLAKPTKVKASVYGSWINVSWEKVDGANSYLVYRANSEKGLYTMVGKVGSDGFVDHQVLAGQTYYYKIVASNGDEKTRSGYSEITAITAVIAQSPTIILRKDVELPSTSPTPIEPNDATIGRVHLSGNHFSF